MVGETRFRDKAPRQHSDTFVDVEAMVTFATCVVWRPEWTFDRKHL